MRTAPTNCQIPVAGSSAKLLSHGSLTSSVEGMQLISSAVYGLPFGLIAPFEVNIRFIFAFFHPDSQIDD